MLTKKCPARTGQRNNTRIVTMNPQQRNALSHILHELDYPILSKHAITSDDILCKGYANLAKLQSSKKCRFDLLASLNFHKII